MKPGRSDFCFLLQIKEQPTELPVKPVVVPALANDSTACLVK